MKGFIGFSSCGISEIKKTIIIIMDYINLRLDIEISFDDLALIREKKYEMLLVE